MKDLRGRVEERHLLARYPFDPRHTAPLLLGGDKTGEPAFQKFVPVAADLF